MISPFLAASELEQCEADLAILADMSNWAVPEYSRNQVDKAGFVLVAPELNLDEWVWAYHVIDNWRSSHSYPLLNFRINLRQKLKGVCATGLVAQRIKRLGSIRAKLVKGTMQLTQMQDIGGCRAIVNTPAELQSLIASYGRSTFAHEFRGEKNYIDSPKPDGYRSHHLIYQYKAKPGQNGSYDKLRIEVQLRTTLQHAWATAVEAVGIFTKQALKSNIGNKDWLRLFALMGSEIATLERTTPVPGTPANEIERVQEICELCQRLRAVETLNAYRATLQHVGTTSQTKNAKYYMMQYDYDKNTVFVWDYRGDASQKANAEYTSAEQHYKENERNIVLVSVDSIQQLRRAYPNYFLDTAHFTRLLTNVLKRSAECAPLLAS
jgi:hypothetical protein